MNKYKITYSFYNRGKHTNAEYFKSWKTCQERIKELFESDYLPIKQVEVSVIQD